MKIMTHQFLQNDNLRPAEAKWNMFHFQDHLLSWIAMSADYFHRRDYPNAFEAMTNVYTDIYGFLKEGERKELDDLFNKAKRANDMYIAYNIDYQNIAQRVKHHSYSPPAEVYHSILEFRKKLMTLMTRYQLTIPQVKKSGVGAGSQ